MGKGGGGFKNARQQGRRQHDDTPMDNRKQNRQTDAVADKLKLSDAKRRELHDWVNGMGWGYSRTLEEALFLFPKRR